MAAVVSQILVQTLRLDQHVSSDLPLQLSAPARGGLGGSLTCLAAERERPRWCFFIAPPSPGFCASFYLTLIADTLPQHSISFLVHISPHPLLPGVGAHRDVPPADCGMDRIAEPAALPLSKSSVTWPGLMTASAAMAYVKGAQGSSVSWQHATARTPR